MDSYVELFKFLKNISPNGAFFILIACLCSYIYSSTVVAGMAVKAGDNPVLGFIPLVNTYLMYKYAFNETSKIILMIVLSFVPIVNAFVLFALIGNLAKQFGYGFGMALLMCLLPFIGMPIVAFSSNDYYDGRAERFGVARVIALMLITSAIAVALMSVLVKAIIALFGISIAGL